jgi:hypothetical protein
MKSITCRGASAVSILALLMGACSSGDGGGGDEVDSTASIAEAIVSSDGALTATISFNDWGSG